MLLISTIMSLKTHIKYERRQVTFTASPCVTEKIHSTTTKTQRNSTIPDIKKHAINKNLPTNRPAQKKSLPSETKTKNSAELCRKNGKTDRRGKKAMDDDDDVPPLEATRSRIEVEGDRNQSSLAAFVVVVVVVVVVQNGLVGLGMFVF